MEWWKFLVKDEPEIERSQVTRFASSSSSELIGKMNSTETSGYPINPLKRKFETMKNDRQQPTTNRTELENGSPSASPKYSFYQPSKIDHGDLKVKLKSSRLQSEVQLLEMQVSLQRHHKDTDEVQDNLRKALVNDHSTIIYCIDEMGLLCAYEAVKICIANAKAMEECDFLKYSISKCLDFLEESLSLIENSLPNGHENIFDAGCDFEKMVAAGYISPKLHQLFKLLRSFGGATKVSCIIFVDRIITAKILDIVLKRVDLSHFQVSYLTGNATTVDAMSAKMQNETRESFRSGEILEAITTLRCNESFSMERLELLGDSVLKYAVTCDLYLRHPNKHEGQLSAKRSLQVCNSALYNLGIRCGLQGYIRDVAYDPIRWTPPGQLPLRPCPCDHGVDTIEVPIDAKYQSEEPKIVSPKCCDLGHRWLGSKTISDCVEALVGAYFIGGGLTGALHCMKWLGISCDLDPWLVIKAITIASLHTYTPKLDVLQGLESKLGYEFQVKGLLLEAITHASNQDNGVGYCYQRLEFLGDSLLDLLITCHLFRKHNDIDPGEQTDLRSASVNNENFAYATVRRNLHMDLQHRSGSLQTQISEYVNFVATSSTDTNSLLTKKSPKVLGDIVESIAGVTPQPTAEYVGADDRLINSSWHY